MATLETTPAGFAEQSLADIACSRPGATAVLRRYKLDYCCCGALKLADAVAANGLSLAGIEAALQAIPGPADSGTQALTIERLIDHIEAQFHGPHRRDLPPLIDLARKIDGLPRGMVTGLVRFAKELDLHMEKEEGILFPLLRGGARPASPAIQGPIAVLTGEHKAHADYIRKLESLTGNFVPPEGAGETWRALYAGFSHFADALIEHIHLENNILFPRFSALHAHG